jgi:hypothetical protein
MAEATVRRKKLYTLPNGRRVEIQSLGLSDYVQAREEALGQYKRARLQTWTKNIDLLGNLPESERRQLLQEAFERAENLAVEDLPEKTMRLPTRNAQGKFVRDQHGELLLQKQAVEYTAWWMSETPEGRLYMTWLSIHRADPTFTMDDADAVFRDHVDQLEKIADEVGEISGAQLGNSSAPPETAGQPTETAQTRRERRKARRRIGR